MQKGKISQVSGSVVDVHFDSSPLPRIKEALEVYVQGEKRVMEVASHIGENTVRCIMLSDSDGLACSMEVLATGSGITVPVGPCTLGRMFNVLGDPIDGLGAIDEMPSETVFTKNHRHFQN